MQSSKKKESGFMTDPLAKNSQRAVFLDRDGVLNADSGYVSRVADLEICAGVPAGLRALQAAGYLLLVITNQSGIARGYYQEKDVHRVHDHMNEVFSREGVTIAGWYYCPHHPRGEVAPYNIPCDCRKPAPGMVYEALADFPTLRCERSYFVGDKVSDTECGRQLGMATIQIMGNYPRDPNADFHVSDFSGAVAQILGGA